MQNRKTRSFIVIALLFAGVLNAQDVPQRDSLTRKKFNLIFINKEPSFSAATKEKMVDAFFEVYPKLVKKYNRNAARKVVFVIDPEYKGVAATGGGVIRYNPTWLKDHPEDIDVVTHEVMHVVQAYGRGGGPGWLTEGIADYVRYKYGVNNVKGKWTLPAYKEGQSYTNSYRITARFLLWLQQHGHKKIVEQLDNASRTHTYKPELWQEFTGKTLDELWSDYAKDPDVKIKYH